MSGRLSKQRRPSVAEWLDKDYPRKTYWTQNEAIAWIATRAEQAVGLVGEASRQREWKGLDSLNRLLVEWAIASSYEVDPAPETIGARLAKASAEFNRAIAAGELSLGGDGIVAGKQVKQRWPAKEGKGRGWSGYRYHNRRVLDRLVHRLRTTEKDVNRDRLRVEVFGLPEHEAHRYETEFSLLLKKAFQLAEERIGGDERLFNWTSGEKGLNAEGAARQRSNLASWKKPRGGRIPKRKNP
jgi:hypothetical protein